MKVNSTTTKVGREEEGNDDPWKTVDVSFHREALSQLGYKDVVPSLTDEQVAYLLAGPDRCADQHCPHRDAAFLECKQRTVRVGTPSPHRRLCGCRSALFSDSVSACLQDVRGRGPSDGRERSVPDL